MHMLNFHYVNRTRRNAPMEKRERDPQKLDIMGNLEVSVSLGSRCINPIKISQDKNASGTEKLSI